MKKVWIAFIVILFCGACAGQANTMPDESQITASPTDSVTKIPTIRPTISPTPALSYREYELTVSEPVEAPLTYVSNLWTQIPEEKITHYPVDQLNDYLYDHNGDLWLAGGFGIVRQKPNGTQEWYTIFNELPYGYITKIVESPSNEIWAIGLHGTILRFDSQHWINEGEIIPDPIDSRKLSWVCISNSVEAIDFDAEGNAWVITQSNDLYAQLHNQWINFFIPKEVVRCGVRIKRLIVESPENITIVIEGCCESGLVVYTYDGILWAKEELHSLDDPYTKFDVNTNSDILKKGLIEDSGYDKWPFSTNQTIPYSIIISVAAKRQIFIDDNGAVWIYRNGDNFYNNKNDRFTPSYYELKYLIQIENDRISNSELGKIEKIKKEIGKDNLLWYYNQENWQYAYLPEAIDEELYAMAHDTVMIDYAASNTSVYSFQNGKITRMELVREGFKPVVIAEDGKLGDCSYHKNYSVFSNCDISKTEIADTDFHFKLLQQLNDGALIYVNNKIIAKIDDGEVKSFLFHTFDIESAVLDDDENIWIVTRANGVLKFSPDIFDDYQGIISDDAE